jgi:hypothetical protein
MTRIVRITLLNIVIMFGCREAGAQMDTAYATQYFLDSPPSTAPLTTLPTNAREVIIAKVRMVGRIAYLIGRHQSDQLPPRPKDLFGVDVEVVEALRGRTDVSARHKVYFGVPGEGRNYKYPHTPRMYAREYFIVSYIGEDKVRRLLGFPVSRGEYDEWEREVSRYERIRGLPGARDQ